MNRAILIEMLGKPFSALIKEYHFPAMAASIIHNKICSAFAYQLSGLPTNSERLKKKIIHLLNRGRIEEIEQKNSGLLIRVSFQHRSELWLVELLMNGQTWDVGELLYRGEISRKWFLPAMIGGLCVLVLSGAILWGYSMSKENMVFADSHETDDEVLKDDESEELEINALDQKEMDNHGLDHQDLNKENDNHGLDHQDLNKENDLDNLDVVEQTYTIHIQAGMNSQEVADLLVEQGLARTQKEVTELFAILNVQRKIQTGIFKIPHNATYLEIIEIITN